MKKCTCGLALIFWAVLAGASLFLCSFALAENTDRGTFYVIGAGPAGPDLITKKGLRLIKEKEYIVCSKEMQKRFSKYLEDKTIMFDPWKGMFDYKGTPYRDLLESGQETLKAFEKERIRIREEKVKKIKEKLSQGKDVLLLDSGNPCLFGPSHWFIEGFDPEDVCIVPGVSAGAAALAALKVSSIPAHETKFLLQSAPYFMLEKDDQTLKDLSNHPSSMIFYMALRNLKDLVSRFKEHYPEDLPAAIVYYAGYPKKQKIIRGSLKDIVQKAGQVEENWMGMLILGRCLKGQPYRSRVEDLF